MRYAFPHLNSIGDISPKDGRHSSQLFYFLQTRRGTRKVDSRRAGEDVRGREKAMRQPCLQRLAWKVDYTHACTPVSMVGGKDGFDAQEFRGRRWRRYEREIQREGAGAGECGGLRRVAMRMRGRVLCPVRECMMHLRTVGVEVRSGQHEVSDTCIDEQGRQGNALSTSACRCVEKAMLENVGTHN
ncbi:hypothetical protein B0H13DRAFT_2560553 [Mycena leptocephala]|nr:hypothetical protein B0H13DRAFT_2560553 [Mycena leptocephala]